MLLNKIKTNFNNHTFKASVTKELRDEIAQKGEYLEQLPKKKRHVTLSGYISYVKEIADTFPEAHVGIDKEDSSKYVVKYLSHTFFIPRRMDKEYFQYTSLREGLKNLEIVWNLAIKANRNKHKN